MAIDSSMLMQRCCVIFQPLPQSKRSSRRKMPVDELAATAAAALATLPINKQVVLPSGGSIGTTELPLFAGGALQPPETEKNSYSSTMLNLIMAQKRPPGGGTASRRRVPDSELDMAVVTDQLCNRRYHVKEMSQNMKVSASLACLSCMWTHLRLYTGCDCCYMHFACDVMSAAWQ